MQHFGQPVTADHGGQGDQDFDLILVHPLEQPVTGGPEEKAIGQAAAHLDQEDMANGGAVQAALGLQQKKQGKKDDHPHTVVEQGFAADDGFQFPWRPCLVHDPQYGNGIGG